MSKSFIISGGGTGGHIFPALSIANGLKARYPDAEIHFIGAKGKMEMTRVPAAGFNITGVPIAGINRQKPWKRVAMPVDRRCLWHNGWVFPQSFKSKTASPG